jgi:hypothetical protein
MTEYQRKRQERERRNNVRRLSVAMSQRAGDAGFIQQLARLLYYMPEQLVTDIHDLDEYTSEKVNADSVPEDAD